MKTELHCQQWKALLESEQRKPYFVTLEKKLRQARHAGKAIYPQQDDVFAAFRHTPFAEVKVVILGQDPYHQPEQACGLAFSVNDGVKLPPSLNNIYKALEKDINGFEKPDSGNLTQWAEQGVLLLNTVLTVEHGSAHSHASWGWENFTAAVMQALNQHPEPLVFMLWGKHAQRKGELIMNSKHCILHSAHPSPLSAHRGFLQCEHFSKANDFLTRHGRTPVDWNAICQPRKQQRQQKLAL